MNTDDLDNARKCIYVCGHKSIAYNRYFVSCGMVRIYCNANDLMFESIMECMMGDYMLYCKFDYVYLNDAGTEIVRAKLDMNRL